MGCFDTGESDDEDDCFLGSTVFFGAGFHSLLLLLSLLVTFLYCTAGFAFYFLLSDEEDDSLFLGLELTIAGLGFRSLSLLLLFQGGLGLEAGALFLGVESLSEEVGLLGFCLS